MRNWRLVFLMIFLVSLCMLPAKAQLLSNLRQDTISIEEDTLQLDTLSIIPGSVSLFDLSGSEISRDDYEIIPAEALLVWKKLPAPAKVHIRYRVFPYNFAKKYYHKDPAILDSPNAGYHYQPIRRRAGPDEEEEYGYSQLYKNGSISRGVAFGNQQDLALNSHLDLQLAGNLTKDIELQAAITDQNIPIEPEGNTAQLQDFDRVFIQLKTQREKLTLGDIQMNSIPEDYFLSFLKKTQGVSAERAWETATGNKVHIGGSGGFSRGKFSRNEFNGREGDQGPYRLTGTEGEQFIIIVSGTERVYLNGRLLQRGEQNDYVIDYNRGEVTFMPC